VSRALEDFLFAVIGMARDDLLRPVELLEQ
jgi:hypothetical protein